MNKVRTAGCVAVVVVFSLVGAAAQNPNELPKGTGLIVGQVVDADSGRPVADVAVTPVLASNARADSNANQSAVVTDAEGHFVFRGLGAGAYILVGRRAGYVESQLGSVRAVGPGQPIILDEGGRVGGLTLRLWKYGVIAGTVTDENGEPLTGVSVRAMQRLLTAGHWRLGSQYAFEHTARTDDRGQYRISDLAPGNYSVVLEAANTAVPASVVAEIEAGRQNPAANAGAQQRLTQAMSNIGAAGLAPGSIRAFQRGAMTQNVVTEALAPPRAGSLAYQTQFFSASSSAANAQVIAINAGQGRDGVNFSLTPVPSVTVGGIVSGAGNAFLPLHLVRSDAGNAFSELDTAATVTAADGSFTLIGVPPGDYLLKALMVPPPVRTTTQIGNTTRMQSSAPPPAEPTYWISSPVSVGDKDVRDVSVTVNTGARIQGRVVFDGTAQPVYPTLTVTPAEGRVFGKAPTDATVWGNGETFVTPQLPPGAYFLAAPATMTTRTREAWTLVSVSAGGQDLGNSPIRIDGRDITDVVIKYSQRSPSGVAGAVQAGGDIKLNSVSVMVFPTARDLWVDYGQTSPRMKAVRPSASGAYAISGLPDGEYNLTAIADDAAADWREPAHLAVLAASAVKVTLSGTTVTQPLTARRVSSPKTTPGGGSPSPISLETETAAVSGPFVVEDGQQAPARDGTTLAVAGRATIDGTVTRAGASPTPVRRAIVTLTATEPRVARSAVTDDEGHFAFDQLPAGRFTLRATKSGFIAAAYGATKPGRAGTPVTLLGDASVTVTLPLTPTAVISGVVRDGHGQPIRGARVEAYRWASANGSRSLERAGNFSAELTDDRGAFRIAGLAPGEYLIAADRANIGFYMSLPQITAEDWRLAQRELTNTQAGASQSPAASRPVSPAERPLAGYVQTYHPSAAAPGNATSITVAAGDERSGVDITAVLTTLVRVRATVTGPDGAVPPNVQARLVPTIPVSGLSAINLEAGRFFPVTDGRVAITGVPPGDYMLHIGGSSIPAPPPTGSFSGTSSPDRTLGLPMWAMAPVTVTGRDVDLAVQLQHGYSVSGKIVFEGVAQPPAMTTLRPSMAGPRQGGVSLSTLFLPASAAGEFKYEGLVPAAYRLQLTPPRGWTVKSAMMNGRDAADLPVDINSDVTDAVITLSDRVARLSGTLQSASGAPAPDFFVIIFSKNPAHWLPASRRIVSVRPSTTGQFIVNALPPGDYLLAAVTDVESGEWFDPEFLRQLLSAAVPVTIAEGEQKVQDLRIK